MKTETQTDINVLRALVPDRRSKISRKSELFGTGRKTQKRSKTPLASKQIGFFSQFIEIKE